MSEKKAGNRQNRTRKTETKNTDENQESEDTAKRKTPTKRSGASSRRGGASRSRKKTGGSTKTKKSGSSGKTATKDDSSAQHGEDEPTQTSSSNTAKKSSRSGGSKKSTSGTAKKSSGTNNKTKTNNGSGKKKTSGKKQSSDAKKPAGKGDGADRQSARSTIENEILGVAEVEVDEADYNTYLRTLVAQVDRVDDETYDNLSEKTQLWFTDSVKAMNEGQDPVDPRKVAPSAAAKKEVAEASKEREDYHTGKGEHARKGKMSALLRDVICKNIEITASEAMEEVEKHGYEPAHGTFMTIFSYTRNALQHAERLGMLTRYKDVDHAE